MERKRSDSLRVCATTIVSGLLFSLIFSRNVFASADLNLGASSRTYPLSGVADVDTGYGLLLWGETNSGSPLYGYLRPFANFSSALSYNALEGALEFYPISFFGGRAGGEAIQNDRNYKAYDCLAHVCTGRFYHSYALAELTLGMGPLFVQGRWRRDRWTERESGVSSFIEPTAGFALPGSGDSVTTYRGMLGTKLGLNWSVAGVFVYSQMDSNHGISRLPFGIVRYSSGPFSVAVGAGSFSSPLKRSDTTALLFLNWEVKPSLGLH